MINEKRIHMIVKSSLGSLTNKNKNKNETPNRKESSRVKTKRAKERKCISIVEKIGHWKNEFPKFLKKKQGIHHSLLVASCLVADSTNS